MLFASGAKIEAIGNLIREPGNERARAADDEVMLVIFCHRLAIATVAGERQGLQIRGGHRPTVVAVNRPRRVLGP